MDNTSTNTTTLTRQLSSGSSTSQSEFTWKETGYGTWRKKTTDKGEPGVSQKQYKLNKQISQITFQGIRVENRLDWKNYSNMPEHSADHQVKVPRMERVGIREKTEDNQYHHHKYTQHFPDQWKKQKSGFRNISTHQRDFK